MPLIINSLGGGDTHTATGFPDKKQILRNLVCASQSLVYKAMEVSQDAHIRGRIAASSRMN